MVAAVFILTSCDLLDRPNPQNLVDTPDFWRTEASVRAFAEEFYTQFFPGFNSGWGVDYTPIRGTTFSDYLAVGGQPTPFPNMRPTALGSSGALVAWQGAIWAGPTWNFYWIRKANMMIDRMERHAADAFPEATFNHWIANARFFKALEYARLVSVFGDVPFFEAYFPISDRAEMFRNRDPRNVVMDNVYDYFRWVVGNFGTTAKLRPRSGGHVQDLNLDVAAAFISRWMLFEGTWQWYHNQDAERAAKFLKFAVEASEFLMNSGRYSISSSSDIRALFSEFTATPSNPEVILWRTYNNPGATHHIASYANLQHESQGATPNLHLIKNWLTSEGKVWQNSANPEDFNLTNLIATRDPRFEASFAPIFPNVVGRTPTGIYTVKFIDRNAINLAMQAILGTGAGLAPQNAFPQYTSNTNTNAFPVARLGEVLLNWIEAKAVLQEMNVPGFTVSQADIDRSINRLRARPVHPEAAARGVRQTPAMQLTAITASFDPNRDMGGFDAYDLEVSPLMWEIRRERMMELFQELPRVLDLRRWRKMHYMDTQLNPNIVLGAWMNIPRDMPGLLTTDNARNATIRVQRWDRSIVIYDGTNAADMVGFRVVNTGSGGAFLHRNIFGNQYNAPIGQNQIDLYREAGFTLDQTQGW